MLFTCGAVQNFEFLQKKAGMEIEDSSIEEEILLSALVVFGCSSDVQQYIVVLMAGEHCAIVVGMPKAPPGLAQSLLAASPFIFLTSRRAFGKRSISCKTRTERQ